MENKNWNVYPDFQQDFAQAPPYYGPLSPLVTSQNPFNPQFNPYGFNNAARSPRIEYVSRIAGHYWLKQEDYNMLTDITMEKLIDRAFRNVNNRFGKSYYDVCADFSIPGVWLSRVVDDPDPSSVYYSIMKDGENYKIGYVPSPYGFDINTTYIDNVLNAERLVVPLFKADAIDTAIKFLEMWKKAVEDIHNTSLDKLANSEDNDPYNMEKCREEFVKSTIEDSNSNSSDCKDDDKCTADSEKTEETAEKMKILNLLIYLIYRIKI